ncbi:MAG: hypothetical protein QXV24_01480 [Nitrososphaerota archaeon]
MSNDRSLSAVVALTITGGSLILLNSVIYMILSLLAPSTAWFPTWGCPMCGMMWRWGGPMMAWPFTGMMAFVSILGIVAGALLILGGLMIRVNPKDTQLWGIIILIFSIIGFLSGGGFLIGSIIGLIGGIIAITKT